MDRVDRTEARKDNTSDVRSVLMIRGLGAIRGKDVSGLASGRATASFGSDRASPSRIHARPFRLIGGLHGMLV